jgi:hypothetical protein
MKPLGRFSYLLYGLLLMAAKFGLDALVAQSFGKQWSPGIYWSPVTLAVMKTAGVDSNYLFALVAIAVPFTVVGILLTVRRLTTLQLGAWLSFLFFLPVVNLLFFCFLVAAPEFDRTGDDGTRPWPAPAVLQSSSIGALFLSAAIAALCAVLAACVTIQAFKAYSFGVFFALPFGIGLLTTLLVSIPGPRSFGHCFGSSILALVLCGSAMLLFAFEGLGCLVMSLPLALPLAAIGVFVGREIARPGPGHLPAQSAIVALLIVSVCPLSAIGERSADVEPETFAVVTAVDIAAPPERVWKSVISFPELPPAREWIFRAGIAYPIRARIEGQGVGAVRYCEFSTGPFVEPITTWQEPAMLAFAVTSSPAPMQELSPYDIHPPHLDGFLQSKRGQFRLVPLNGGRGTRLEGTTWYQQSLYPASYWRLWTDWIIHQIHQRVLNHIKVLAENGTALGLN